ncbi:MAG: amino acid ABC transporter permease [Caldilineaceae bacterium]|nr:amino acid ABC transporter permease [Caldilineaceae bacterium]MBP8107086.1 amino acid ABC transporter permease [Caldilineaceae bacterium]MBP8124680.1 amino acid ABC transporter permease [Caldilineaceae bacterium]MBP9072611.1 amino acid ABC transporter permease [Caldilineaceae bacterium]
MAVQTLSAPRRRSGLADRLAALPYWLLATILLGVILFWNILSNSDYNTIFQAVSKGVGVTVYVCLVSFAGALIIGLVVGMARLSSSRFVIEISSFYVEILRGVPMLVLLYYVAFVGAPGLVDLINWAGDGLVRLGVTGMGAAWADFSVRDLDFTTRAMIALVVGYSAFISEIFRAGIESIERGQTEAARSMGMNYWQTMRFIILPQATRRVLPPLGNDFIAMLKDSALVSVLGVQDITQMGKLYASSTFRFFETYNVVAFLYLAMTVALSLVVRYMEQRMPRG